MNTPHCHKEKNSSLDKAEYPNHRIRGILRRFNALGILGILKTIYYNFKILPFNQAYRLPILISKKTTMYLCHRGCIKFIDKNPCFGNLRFGLSDLEYSYDSPSFVTIQGMMIIRGNNYHVFAPGLSLNIWKNGVLDIGDSFSVAPHLRCFVSNRVVVGDNNMWSFYNLVMDTDAHRILDDHGRLVNSPRNVVFGKNCWVGAYCKILKGAHILDGCIIGSGSTITKKLQQSKSVYVGDKAVRENITWDRGIL